MTCRCPAPRGLTSLLFMASHETVWDAPRLMGKNITAAIFGVPLSVETLQAKINIGVKNHRISDILTATKTKAIEIKYINIDKITID